MGEMILLGAGASVKAKVPDAYEMTKEIANRFKADSILRKYSHVISFVIGGLLFKEGQRGNDPLSSGVNVEDLFNAVQLLAERNTLEAAPFVGSWHAMVEEFDKVTPSPPRLNRLYDVIYENVAKQILKALSQTPSSFNLKKIDEALEDLIDKKIEAARKGRSTSSSRNVGKAIGEYLEESAKKWSEKLKPSSSASSSQLDKEFQRAVEQLQAQPGEGRIFQQTAEMMIRMLKDIVWIDDPERVTYLGLLLNLVEKQKRLVVAALNYDNAIELMATSKEVLCKTGIEEWSKSGNFDFTGDGFFLLKLHGSIDWTWERNVTSPERPMPHSVISRVVPDQLKEAWFHPAVIFGQRNKLTAEGPFLDLLRVFQQELLVAKTLTVIGYFFRDPHINVYISHWLNQSQEHCIRIVSPNFVNSRVDFARKLLDLRSQSPERVEIIEEKAEDALNKLYSSITQTTGR